MQEGLRPNLLSEHFVISVQQLHSFGIPSNSVLHRQHLHLRNNDIKLEDWLTSFYNHRRIKTQQTSQELVGLVSSNLSRFRPGSILQARLHPPKVRLHNSLGNPLDHLHTPACPH